MQPTERTFDRSDLILSWFSKRKFGNSHEDLRSYHDAVYLAFSKAFGVRLDVAPEKSPIPDEDGQHGLFLEVAQSYERIRSPFSNYLCGTREISEIYRKYGEPLDEAGEALRTVHLSMMLDLIERIWGCGVPQQVGNRELGVCGHPGWKAPDPVDFW